MVVKNLTVQNIRSHSKLKVTLSPNVTAITGNNGSGKTSLIEALYIALQGSSFRGSDTDILQYNSPWWRINIDYYNSHNNRIITFDPNLTTGKKKFNIDDKISYRLTPKYKHPIVLFEPDDLRLLYGSPTRRRQFIDRFIAQLDPQYSNYLSRYERALRQRNNLLKKPFTTKDDLFAWDVALSNYGAYIINQRIDFIEMINNRLSDEYNKIAETKDVISVHYSHTFIDNVQQKILADLNTHIEKDKILGFTSVGPHRHDVIFKFNNQPVIDTASRGEVRTAVLALKFIEVDIIQQITDKQPLILLDDVFSELDDERQNRLLSKDNQIVLTSTKMPDKIKSSVNNINLNKTLRSK